jgi:hypothetical protein
VRTCSIECSDETVFVEHHNVGDVQNWVFTTWSMYRNYLCAILSVEYVSYLTNKSTDEHGFPHTHETLEISLTLVPYIPNVVGYFLKFVLHRNLIKKCLFFLVTSSWFTGYTMLHVFIMYIYIHCIYIFIIYLF